MTTSQHRSLTQWCHDLDARVAKLETTLAPGNLLRSSQAAQVAGVSRQTINEAAQRGDLPVAARRGNRNLFARAAVIAWAESRA